MCRLGVQTGVAAVQATAAGEAGGDAEGALLEGVRMQGRGDGCTTTVDLLCLPGVLNLDTCGEHWGKGAALNRDDLLTAPVENCIHTFRQLTVTHNHKTCHKVYRDCQGCRALRTYQLL